VNEGVAQQTLADSLLGLLPKTAESTQRVDILNDLAWELKEDSPEKARLFLQESALLAARLNYLKGEAQSYNNLGVLENIHSNLNDAIIYFQKALPLREKIKDSKGVAALYNNIGNLYEDKRDYVGALTEYKKSLAILESIQDEKRIARVHYNIGLLHERMGNYFEAQDELLEYLKIVERQNDKEGLAKAYTVLGHAKSELEFFADAEKSYQKALSIRQEIGEEKEIADAMLNVGNSYGDLKKYPDALLIYQQALTIYEKGDFPEEKANALNNIGVAYKDLGDFSLALKNFEAALTLREKLEDKRGLMETYNGIGDVKRRQKDSKAALLYAQKYFNIAEEIKDEKFIQKAYKDLALAHEMLGNYKKALEYRTKYDELRYKRLNEGRLKDFERREVVYGDFKKQLEIEKQERQLHQGKTLRNTLLGATLAFILISILLYNRYKVKNNAAKALALKNEIIELEQQRSEALLLNILPESTAQELKANGRAEAKYYDSVTVLFTDFKAFTQVAEQLSPAELVEELDICFRAFDAIVEANGVEKIKTIGDAYMCVAGLPTENKNHAFMALKTAFEMQDFIQSYNDKRRKENKTIFEMRIGLHCGSVVAGVVGNKKFAYDIWGDTVNIAARMEAAGTVGKVNISQTVYEFVKNAFICEHRGKIAAKNKGEIDMYFVENKQQITSKNDFRNNEL
jgi:class 3 adenylate cyclase/TolA-binding protein